MVGFFCCFQFSLFRSSGFFPFLSFAISHFVRAHLAHLFHCIVCECACMSFQNSIFAADDCMIQSCFCYFFFVAPIFISINIKIYYRIMCYWLPLNLAKFIQIFLHSLSPLHSLSSVFAHPFRTRDTISFATLRRAAVARDEKPLTSVLKHPKKSVYCLLLTLKCSVIAVVYSPAVYSKYIIIVTHTLARYYLYHFWKSDTKWISVFSLLSLFRL